MYEESDEIITSRNPKGGRPQAMGRMLFKETERAFHEVSQIETQTGICYMMGYCPCGRKVVAGEKWLRAFAGIVRRKYIEPMPRVPLRIRFAKFLLKGSPT